MPLQPQQPPSASPSVRGANQERDALPVTSDEKGRCRLHGAANGSDGPPGERDGQYRHGERDQGRDCGAAEIQRVVENAPRRPDVMNTVIDPVLMILATFLRFARNEHSAGTYKSILPTVGFVAFQSKTRFRTIPRSRVHATSGSATPTFSAPYSSVSWKRALGLALSAENVL